MVKNNSNGPENGKNDDFELAAFDEQLFLENSAIIKQSLEKIDESIVLPASLRGAELLKKHAEEIASYKNEAVLEDNIDKDDSTTSGDNVVKVNFGKKAFKYLAVACTFLVALTVLFNRQNFDLSPAPSSMAENSAGQYNELRSVLGAYAEDRDIISRSQQQFASPIVGVLPETADALPAPEKGDDLNPQVDGSYESSPEISFKPAPGAGGGDYENNPTTGGSGGAAVTSAYIAEPFTITELNPPHYFVYDSNNLYTAKVDTKTNQSVVTVESLENGALNSQIVLAQSDSVVKMFADDNKLVLVNSSYLEDDKTGDKSVDELKISDLTAAMFTEYNETSSTQANTDSESRLPNPGGNIYASYSYPITKVDVYDVNNEKEPVLVASYVQDGFYRDSYYWDGTAYLVTDKFINTDARNDELIAIDIIPFYSNDGSSYSLVAEKDMEIVANSPYSLNFTVVSQTNFNSTSASNVKALLTSSALIYEGENSVILSYDTVEEDGTISSNLLKFEDGIFVKGAKLKGHIYSDILKTKDGYMLISTKGEGATTSNSFCMLNEDLKMVSEISDISSEVYINLVEMTSQNSLIFNADYSGEELYYIDITNSKSPKLVGKVASKIYSGTFVKLYDNVYFRYLQSAENGNIVFDIVDLSDVSSPKIVATADDANNYTTVFVQACSQIDADGNIYILVESFGANPSLNSFIVYRFNGKTLEKVKEKDFRVENYSFPFIKDGKAYFVSEAPVEILNI